MQKILQLLGIAEKEASALPVNTPDVTKAQIGSMLQFAAAAAVSFGVLPPTDASVITGASGLIAVGWMIGDSILRNGRAHAVGMKILAGVQAPHAAGLLPTALAGEILPSPTLDGTGSRPDAAANAAIAADKAEAANSSPVNEVKPPPPPSSEVPKRPTYTTADLAAAGKSVEDAQAAVQAAVARLKTIQATFPQSQ